MRVLAFVCLTSLVALSLGAQEGASQGYFERVKTSIEGPLDMRDPFKKKIQKRDEKKEIDGRLGESAFSNLATLDGVELKDIKIVGVILGEQRRALAREKTAEDRASKKKLKWKASENAKPKGDVYIITEGMKIGKYAAEVKAILPGGIVLVEKIKNVYDQDEYIETVMPVILD